MDGIVHDQAAFAGIEFAGACQLDSRGRALGFTRWQMNEDLTGFRRSGCLPLKRLTRSGEGIEHYRLGTFSHTMADTTTEMENREKRLTNFRNVLG